MVIIFFTELIIDSSPGFFFCLCMYDMSLLSPLSPPKPRTFHVTRLTPGIPRRGSVSRPAAWTCVGARGGDGLERGAGGVGVGVRL